MPAYRRSRRSTSRRTYRPRSRARYSPRSRVPARRRARSTGVQTIRIVVEQRSADPLGSVSETLGMKPLPAPRKARF